MLYNLSYTEVFDFGFISNSIMLNFRWEFLDGLGCLEKPFYETSNCFLETFTFNKFLYEVLGALLLIADTRFERFSFLWGSSGKVSVQIFFGGIFNLFSEFPY